MLLALSFLMPGHYLPWPSFQPQWVSALALLLVAAGLGLPAASRLHMPGLAWLALLLAAVPWLQFAVGTVVFFSDALLSSLYLLALALAIAAGAAPDRAGRSQALLWLLSALLVSAALSVALALLQWLQLGSHALVADLRPGDRPYANLAQPNHLATLLSLGVVALLHMYQTRRLAAASACWLLGWLGLGLVMTQSRTGWLSMALLAMWCLWQGRRAALRVPAHAVLLAFAAFAGLIMLWGPLNEMLLMRSGSLEDAWRPAPAGCIGARCGTPCGCSPGRATAGSRCRWPSSAPCCSTRRAWR